MKAKPKPLGLAKPVKAWGWKRADGVIASCALPSEGEARGQLMMDETVVPVIIMELRPKKRGKA